MFLLRLPGAVESIFVQWLRDFLPDRSEKILNRLRELHGGKLSDPRFGHRMHGSGPYAHQIRELFRGARRRAGLDASPPGPSASSFLRPTVPKQKRTPTQLELEMS
jgi:DNA repair photolyase